jgi:sodium transport system permease protein
VIPFVRAVLGKELRDGLRDRRTLAMALFFPVLGPVVLGFALSTVAGEARQVDEQGVRLPVVGREHAPHLVEALEDAGIVAGAGPADPDEAVRSGDAEVVLVIPPEFGERLRAGEPAPVRLVVDESQAHARAAVDRVRGALDAWARRTAAQRLVARGIHPAVVAPLAIETVDVSTPQARTAILLSIMPYFLVLAIFVGGMSVAIDATAGERERHSLEPLLVNPVPRLALVLGKIGASAFFGAIALSETAVAFALLPVLFPVERLGFVLRLDPGVMVPVAVLLLPLVLAASSLMVLVAARARSFKAAQTMLSFLMMVPAVPGILLALSPMRPAPWMRVVPALAEQLVVQRLIRGEPVAPAHVALAMGASLAAAALFATAAARLFERGTPLFDR